MKWPWKKNPEIFSYGGFDGLTAAEVDTLKAIERSVAVAAEVEKNPLLGKLFPCGRPRRVVFDSENYGVLTCKRYGA